MSFSITLQTNNSDTNALDKTINDIITLSGTLKDTTSIINPTILISGSIPTNCNYMTISTFGRSYFITDVRSVHNGLFEIDGHVDVLKTYATQIRACSGIVARQENNWNLYIDDGSFKIYQNPRLTLKKFPSGFNTQEFVLAVAGS